MNFRFYALLSPETHYILNNCWRQSLEAGCTYIVTLTLGSLLKTVYFPVYVFCSGHSTYYPSSADCVCPVHDLAERMLPDPELPNQNKSSQLPLNGSTHSNTVTRVNIIHQCLLSQLREGLFISIALFHHRRLLQIMIQNNVSCRIVDV